jgi:hypothetical protein
MFKWPILTATAAAATGPQPGVGEVQQPVEVHLRSPSQTPHIPDYVAHDAGFFQKKVLKPTSQPSHPSSLKSSAARLDGDLVRRILRGGPGSERCSPLARIAQRNPWPG